MIETPMLYDYYRNRFVIPYERDLFLSAISLVIFKASHHGKIHTKLWR